MRQAGRFLPEYRALREQHDFFTMVRTPELAAEVTLQPMRRFELDAAIVFADILPLLEAMGLDLEFTKTDGPRLNNPIRSQADIEALAAPDPAAALDFTMEAIRLTRRELNGLAPLIGFSGAPFTLASYAIEGGSSRTFERTKRLLYGEPRLWRRLMDKLAAAVGGYLKAQLDAGAQALQVFDSWIGALSPGDYREFVLPHTRRAIQLAGAEEADVPLIYFGTGNAGYLPLFQQAGGSVIGVDWRIDLGDAWDILGNETAIQGNLDPTVLFAPVPEIERQAARILDAANQRPGHIFNLGHGVLKDTPVEHVAALVEFVHAHSRRQPSA